MISEQCTLKERLIYLETRLLQLEKRLAVYDAILEEHDEQLNSTRDVRSFTISGLSLKRINWVLDRFELKTRQRKDLPGVFGVGSIPPTDIVDIKMNGRGVSLNPTPRRVDAMPNLLNMTDQDLPCEFRGTTDVVIHHGGFMDGLTNARVICQMKKNPQGHHKAQSYAELLSASHRARKGVVALLTDFCDVWEYMWLTIEGDVVYLDSVKFNKPKGLSALIRILAYDKDNELASLCSSLDAVVGRMRDDDAA